MVPRYSIGMLECFSVHVNHNYYKGENYYEN